MGDLQGTVSWWDLAETSADQPAWAWGPVQNHGQFVAGAVPGGPSAGVAMDGNGGHIVVPWHSSLAIGAPDGTDAWAVWCQFKRGPTGANRTLVSKGGGAWKLRLDATGRPQLESNGVVIATATAVLDTNVHQILAGRAGGSVYIQVDGASQAIASGANYTQPNTLPLRLGADTTSAGAVVDPFNGTLYGVALVPGFYLNSLQGPVVLPRTMGGVATMDVPALLTTWRDPADVTNVAASLPVRLGHGVRPLASATWAMTNNVGGGSGGAITPDSFGRATITPAVAANMNGKAITGQVVGTSSGGFVVTWDNTFRAQWAIARFAQNVSLGDHVLDLATAQVQSVPPTHLAAWFVRAATGPALTAYAAGSSWTTVPATAQAQLPATAAYLAVQGQLVRRA